MHHPQHLRPPLQPARDRQAGLVVAPHADAQRAQAAQREIHVVRPDAQAGGVDEVLERRQRPGIGRHAAEHDVGVAADIFGAGLDRQVDAFVEGAEIQRRAPGVVGQHHGALVVGDLGDGRDVLHLEALRARRLGEHGAGVRPEQRRDAGADQRVVIGGLDAHALERAVAEGAGRPVHAVGDEDVIARTDDRQERGGDRRQPGRQQGDPGAALALERGEGAFQRLRGGGAAPPVLVARAVGDLVFRVRIKQRRGVIDGRIDKPMRKLWIAAGVDQQGVGLDRGLRLLGHVGKGFRRWDLLDGTAGGATGIYGRIRSQRQPLDLATRSFCDGHSRGISGTKPMASGVRTGCGRGATPVRLRAVYCCVRARGAIR